MTAESNPFPKLRAAVMDARKDLGDFLSATDLPDEHKGRLLERGNPERVREIGERLIEAAESQEGPA